MKVERTIAGIVHWLEADFLLRSVGRRIDISHDNGLTFHHVGKISLDPVRNIASCFRLGRRIARTNVKHAIRLRDDLFLIFAGKHIYHADISKCSINRVAAITGSRPLRVCVHGDSVYYGEYRSNPERSPIHVWQSKDLGKTWNVAYRFTGIRHIHGVFKDPFQDCFWVTTGDSDNESAIWRADLNWKTVQPMLSGSQQTRVIDLLFDGDSVFFGSDAPGESNWIYRWQRNSQNVTRLQQVNGTVFHAARFGSQIFFSTCVEPGGCNDGNVAELWSAKLACPESANSSHEPTWYRIAEFRKDIWPMNYFEYGQLIIPAGPTVQPLAAIWISPYATNRDQQSLLIDSSHPSLGT